MQMILLCKLNHKITSVYVMRPAVDTSGQFSKQFHFEMCRAPHCSTCVINRGAFDVVKSASCDAVQCLFRTSSAAYLNLSIKFLLLIALPC
jgi:hypothetical protein